MIPSHRLTAENVLLADTECLLLGYLSRAAFPRPEAAYDVFRTLVVPHLHVTTSLAGHPLMLPVLFNMMGIKYQPALTQRTLLSMGTMVVQEGCAVTYRLCV